MFCYKCGKEGELIDGLCPACYSEENSLVTMEEKYTVTICKTCDAYLLGTWKEFSTIEDIIEDILKSTVKKRRVRFVDTFGDSFHDSIQVSYSFRWGDDAVFVDVTFCGQPDPLKNIVVEEDHRFDIRIKYTVCPRCSKQYGGYYEAVLQIRREGRHLTKEESEDFVKIVESHSRNEMEKNSMAFITQVIMKKEGVNFQLGSLKFAKKLVRLLQDEFGGTYGESYRLTGYDRQAGKERYRSTIAYKLSRFEQDSIVFFNDKLWKVKSEVGKLLMQNFNETLSLEIKKAEDEYMNGSLSIVGRTSMREGMIASISDEDAEVLMMDTYETILLDKKRFGDGVSQGESILVVSINDAFYAVEP